MLEKQVIRVVLYWDDTHWVAQGLERDIAAFGENMKQARDRFAATCQLETKLRRERFGNEWHGIEAAPRQFFDLWDEAEWASSKSTKADGCEVEYRLAA